ncbi:hypothetical protein [Streptomyces sp. PTD5-9]|uniref:hypothetical protein n=1 Tax=Streptomyces sp. PTD5-9 TaxID=3120150 RepID=UPI003FCDE4B8
MNGSVAAVHGDFGDVRFTERTKGMELFVNPLMALYFCVDLPGLARRSLYPDLLERTSLMRQVSSVIEEFRATLPRRRPPSDIPALAWASAFPRTARPCRPTCATGLAGRS